ncbi:MAG: YfcC family protein [Calditrichae bacterium]|nr:YfcC family protein [Calditrichia bacterium]
MAKSFLERVKIPHVFVLLTAMVLFCSILTYLIPSGEYQREKKNIQGTERTVILPGTYEKHTKHLTLKGVFIPDSEDGKASPVSLEQFLSAIPRGMEQSADIIFFIFIIGGVLGVLQRTGMVIAVIQKLLALLGERTILLTVILMVLIAIGGSTLGMGEEFIPLVPLFLIISKEMGYDRIFGLAIVMVAADVGFAAATTNPFTVNVAQGIAELTINGTVPFRVLFLAAILTMTIFYVLRYGAKVKKDPSKSLMKDDDFEISHIDFEKIELTNAHIFTLVSSILIFIAILWSVNSLGWWMAEMSGGFILMAIIAVVVSKLPVDEAVKAFIKGMEEMVVAAMVVGFARGIQVVLNDGQILDTLIFSAASILKNFPNYIAAEGMLLFQTTLNFLIPSGSGQAAVTMPLMAPLSDVLGISRQTAVFAFTCGDGFSNTIIPTSGVLMAMLSLAGIPYTTWLRFMVPLFLRLLLMSAVFLAITVFFPSVWTW